MTNFFCWKFSNKSIRALTMVSSKTWDCFGCVFLAIFAIGVLRTPLEISDSVCVCAPLEVGSGGDAVSLIVVMVDLLDSILVIFLLESVGI